MMNPVTFRLEIDALNAIYREQVKTNELLKKSIESKEEKQDTSPKRQTKGRKNE